MKGRPSLAIAMSYLIGAEMIVLKECEEPGIECFRLIFNISFLRFSRCEKAHETAKERNEHKLYASW